MRRTRFLVCAVTAALLLTVSFTLTAQAGRSVFAGTWTSIDIPDGSSQLLTVSADTTPAVTYHDFFASTCANNGAKSTVYLASGTGTITGSALDVSFVRSGCGAYRMGPYAQTYTYDAGTDTLLDGFGIIWHRKS